MTTDTDDYRTILYTVVDGVLTVTLNRPDQLNAFTTAMVNELDDAFRRAGRDDTVTAVVVTGAGRAFRSRLTGLRSKAIRGNGLQPLPHNATGENGRSIGGVGRVHRGG